MWHFIAWQITLINFPFLTKHADQSKRILFLAFLKRVTGQSNDVVPESTWKNQGKCQSKRISKFSVVPSELSHCSCNILIAECTRLESEGWHREHRELDEDGTHACSPHRAKTHLQLIALPRRRLSSSKSANSSASFTLKQWEPGWISHAIVLARRATRNLLCDCLSGFSN